MKATELCVTLNFSSYDLVHEFKKMLGNNLHAQVSDALITVNDQSNMNIEIRLETIFNDKESEQYFLVVLNDVTKRKQAESEIRIAATAFESQEGMMVTDANNIILRVNRAFTSITGYAAEDVIGKTPHLLSSNKHDAAFYEEMWYSLNNQGAWEGEIWNRRKDGRIYPENLIITAVKDDRGTVTNYVATLTDITLRKAAEDEIQHLAFYDPLTGLPNRRLLIDRLKQAAAYNARSGQSGALLFLDLDHFKTLNDTLGHDVGDLLLQQVAERLESCVREGDTVARLGGDEFVIMLENLSDQAIEVAAQAEVIGEKILAALNQPYQLLNHRYQSTPSIGVVLVNKQNQSPHELLKQADIAMYQAKKAGRNTLRFFDPQMQANINARVDVERELRKALEQKQFQLYYQIQNDHCGNPLGAEALVRWIHPERGLIPPLHFISLAEETGLILSIGLWVLDAACAQLKAWEQESITRDLTLSINVSAKQFHQVDFATQVHAAVLQHDIDPKRLKLELTESMLLDNVESTISTMSVLKDIGIRFSLDDFGTGYSSLQYLKILPLNELKIDQSFVRDIVNDISDQAIVRTIIAMADTLNLTVIAEGVEAEEQKLLLLKLGCNKFQGFLYGIPLPIVEFESKYIQVAQQAITLAMEQYIKNIVH
jgi:diguanylate cyclase (GGDEF)-like protein/PAS domain S-box-containing protein